MLPEIPVETIILSLGYGGIFLLMATNGLSTFPSSQVLYIITGYFIFTGDLNAVLVILFGALGNTLGNIALYEITRRKGIGYIAKFKIFPIREIMKLQIALGKRGAWFLFIGKLIPALKVFVPIAAGIGKTHRGLFAFLMFVSSAIWAIPFIIIGLTFGRSSDVFGKYAIVLIIIAFLVLALLYRFMNSREVLDELEGLEKRDEEK